MILARRVIKRLREENPEALKDIESIKIDENVDLSKINEMTSASEIRQLTEKVKKKRLTSSGLKDNELSNLMKRIGYGK